MANRVRHELWRGGAGALASVLLFAGAAGAESWPHATWYTVIVRPGDTIRILATRYHVAAAQIAALNRIEVVAELHSGEVLRIPAAAAATREAVLSEALDGRMHNYAPPPRAPDEHPIVTSNDSVSGRPIAPANREPSVLVTDGPPQAHPAESVPRFAWPVDGSVISKFGVHGAGERNDGINIAAELGEPIHAAASGTVTYAGDGLKGYGNLILIAHADGYITAYAHADRIEVERGDRVERGEVIGTAGETGGVDRPQLHFEIRHHVKPVDPGSFLVASR